LIDDTSLETALALISELEAALLGLKQLRAYVVQGDEQQRLELVIEKSENKLAEIRRKVIQ
jgi:hypothetical protein